MDFNLINLAITVRTDDAFQLSLRLPLLGNEFADACRNISNCHWSERVCDSCSRQDSCAWNLVFGQKLSSDPSALKRFQKPPLPFMFTFPSRHDLTDRATEIECGLVVIGHAIPYLDLLLDGFKAILFPLAAELLLVGTRDYQGIVNPLGDISGITCPENLVVLSCQDLLENRIWTDTTLRIQLLSPLRLFEDGHLLHNFYFSRFAKSLLRRVSSLAYYYGRYEFACDYKELSRLADAVICTDNHFILRTDRDKRMAGLVGYGSFRGDVRGLLPFLVAGLYVHTGKGSSFGMGAYELIEC
jgi:hypothetical protein